MTVTQQTMTEEQRKSVALEYLKRLDQGKDFFDLFSVDANDSISISTPITLGPILRVTPGSEKESSLECMK